MSKSPFKTARRFARAPMVQSREVEARRSSSSGSARLTSTGAPPKWRVALIVAVGATIITGLCLAIYG